MSALEAARERVRNRVSRVVMPEMEDDRIVHAAARLKGDRLCEVVPLADAVEPYVETLVQARGMKEGIARRMLTRPLYRAAAMVAKGEADAMVAGAVSPTKAVIEAASIGIGLEEGVGLPSSFFLMRFPDGRELIFADCGLNVAPDAEGLAAIARASQRSGKALLGDARVALLSFSTDRSGVGESVDRVREAAELSGFVGPVQGDAALNPRVAEKKGMGDGRANVLVFPSLDAGNIAYKLAQELAGAQALGPILQGFRHPVCDLSRGVRVDDIVDATVVTLALG
ncbi:phosphate acyltransferase [Shimia aestuarii]|uniref:Phosphate acetyltransferase n=1 Tax=Shimia aestuarii TaxID=254406 RepID=A0A1I4MGY4_9RHOB|nr:phosphate acyltransferase [Shimia aestuarii]SFM02350.1 phosphate acetyltransferase [Shimia aestuarii]